MPEYLGRDTIESVMRDFERRLRTLETGGRSSAAGFGGYGWSPRVGDWPNSTSSSSFEGLGEWEIVGPFRRVRLDFLVVLQAGEEAEFRCQYFDPVTSIGGTVGDVVEVVSAFPDPVPVRLELVFASDIVDQPHGVLVEGRRTVGANSVVCRFAAPARWL